MGLTWLVYIVETLTYNGSFFMSLFLWVVSLTALYVIAKVLLPYMSPDKEEVLSVKGIVREGQVIVLSEDVGTLKAHTSYTVSSAGSKWCSLKDADGKAVHSSCGEGTWLHNITDELKDALVLDVSVTREESAEFVLPSIPRSVVVSLICVSLMLHTFLPTRQTAIYMAGAYLIQTVVTAEGTQELGSKAYDAALSQVTSWSEEAPKLKGLVEDLVKSAVKEKEIK